MFPPNTDRAIVEIFQQADGDRSGTIDAAELGRLLSEGRVAFSPRTVRLMLHLFADTADTTRIGPSGFVKLWKELGVWHAKFLQYDRDRSGTIDVTELQQALLSFFFAIPPQVLDLLVRKYDRSGFNKCIGYGEFVECGFIVKGLTEKFRDQDRLRNGTATFDYTNFMLLVIPFIAA
jgi:calcium-binding protein CML